MHSLQDQVEAALIGRMGLVRRDEFDWSVEFGEKNTLKLGSPWRIVSGGGVELTNTDDGQQFGLPAPLDGEAEANRLLGQETVSRVALMAETGDLHVHFGPTIRLEVCTWSGGYEGWQLSIFAAHQWIWIICLGGGEHQVFVQDTP